MQGSAIRGKPAWRNGFPRSHPSARRRTPCRYTARNGYSDEYPVGRYYRNAKGAVIYEGTREIHKLMQADYVLGYRADKPLRCELPPYRRP